MCMLYVVVHCHDVCCYPPQNLLKNTGGSGKPTVFLITDSQIKEESFLEDIDSLLNTGEVPNLFAPDEKAEIMEVSSSCFDSLHEIAYFAKSIKPREHCNP